MSVRRMELFLKFKLPATHSLEEREEAHAHVWRIEVGITGPLEDGRVVSMPVLQEALEPEVQKLRGTFLNKNSLLDEASRAYPTCECLAQYFEKAFERRLIEAGINVLLTQITIAVDEMDGEETGSVKLTIR
jgi:6-pyruvoyl-tetrahydropterin synthase